MKNSDTLLIFPPLVVSSLNGYYPASALLAGACHEAGIGIPAQMDLNRRLVSYLLDSSVLNHIIKKLRHMQIKISPNTHVADYIRYLHAYELATYIRKNNYTGNHLNFSLPGSIPLRRCSHFFETIANIAADMHDPQSGDKFIEQIIHENHWRGELIASFYQKEAKTIGSVKPLFIGFTVAMGPQLFHAIMLSRYLKQVSPNSFICFGGPAMSLLNTETLNAILNKTSWVNAVIKGDGTVTLPQLIKNLKNDKGFEKIPNLICNVKGNHRSAIQQSSKTSEESKPYDSKLTLANSHLSNRSGKPFKAPFPCFDSELVGNLSEDHFLSILESQNCYWGKCTFCDYINVYNNSKFRPRPIREIIEEIILLKKRFGTRAFYLVTDSLAPRRAQLFSKALIEQNLNNALKIYTYIMVDPGFTTENFQLMRKAGFHGVTVGVESLNDRVLELVQKRGRRNDILQLFENAAKAGLHLFVNMIANLPTMTYEEALADIYTLKKVIQTNKYIHIKPAFRFALTASSEMGRNPSAYGLELIYVKHCSYKQFPANDLAYFDRHGMSEIEADKVLREYKGLAILSSETFSSPIQAQDVTDDTELKFVGNVFLHISPYDFDAAIIEKTPIVQLGYKFGSLIVVDLIDGRHVFLQVQLLSVVKHIIALQSFTVKRIAKDFSLNPTEQQMFRNAVCELAREGWVSSAV